MDQNTIQHNKILLETTASNLIKNGFADVFVCDTANQAKEHIMSIIPKDGLVGMGGSVTINELGIPELLKQQKIELITHKPGMDIKQRKEIWRRAILTDIYLASPQAITYSGKMYFIDLYGNRLAAVICGPEKVILVAGYNKLTVDDTTAMWRIRNVAGVENAQRLNKKTPCVTTGTCSDCTSTDRICGVISILTKRPAATQYSIVLVNEHLGF